MNLYSLYKWISILSHIYTIKFYPIPICKDSSVCVKLDVLYEILIWIQVLTLWRVILTSKMYFDFNHPLLCVNAFTRDIYLLENLDLMF